MVGEDLVIFDLQLMGLSVNGEHSPMVWYTVLLYGGKVGLLTSLEISFHEICIHWYEVEQENYNSPQFEFLVVHLL